MNTIIETKVFSAKANKVWTSGQYEDFVLYIAENPDAGKVVPGSGGVRKIRWGKEGEENKVEYGLFILIVLMKKHGFLPCMQKMNVKIFRLMN